MSTKKTNKRCPLQAECERKCQHEGHELDCDYYYNNALGDYVIEDQEREREKRWKESEDKILDAVDAVAVETEEKSFGVNQIIYIPADRLHPHPSNPRKDLGDLSELADSIKAAGILQNLTVVPMELVDPDATIKLGGGQYTIIIGHRRYAAAMQAGVAELPCVITDMDDKEQLQTMLLENMQRSDLTVYEQAQGFQMMLDLGSTVEEIAEKSGFSQTTVRRRVKLLALDREKFEQADKRGASLLDFIELDKVEDPELKNKVLDTIGTANFRNTLANAIEEEKTRRFVADRIADVKDWATEITGDVPWEKYTYVRNYSKWNWHKDSVVERPVDVDVVKYYYRVGRSEVDIYTDKTERQETEAERQRRIAKEAMEQMKAELRTITRRHFELRMDFISQFGAAKKHISEICHFASMEIVGDGFYSRNEVDAQLLSQLLNLEVDENTEYSEFRRMVDAAAEDRPEYVLLVCAYISADDGGNSYYTSEYNNKKMYSEYIHSADPDLDRVYAFLCSLGYEMSDEEKAMQDGTHPVFAENENGPTADPCFNCKSAHPSCERCCNTCEEACNSRQACQKEGEGAA